MSLKIIFLITLSCSLYLLVTSQTTVPPPANFASWLLSQIEPNYVASQQKFISFSQWVSDNILLQKNYLFGNASKITTTIDEISKNFQKFPTNIQKKLTEVKDIILKELNNAADKSSKSFDSMWVNGSALIKNFQNLISDSNVYLTSILINASKLKYGVTYNCSVRHIPSINSFDSNSFNLGLNCLSATNFIYPVAFTTIANANTAILQLKQMITECLANPKTGASCFQKLLPKIPTFAVIISGNVTAAYNSIIDVNSKQLTSLMTCFNDASRSTASSRSFLGIIMTNCVSSG